MNIDFEDEWYGWRLRGRYLVSPDGQRMTQERLRGLQWRDQMELRLALAFCGSSTGGFRLDAFSI